MAAANVRMTDCRQTTAQQTQRTTERWQQLSSGDNQQAADSNHSGAIAGVGLVRREKQRSTAHAMSISCGVDSEASTNKPLLHSRRVRGLVRVG